MVAPFEKAVMGLVATGVLLSLLAALGHLTSLRWQSSPRNEASAITGQSEAGLSMDHSTASPFSLTALRPRTGLIRQMQLEPPFDPLDAIRFRSGDVVVQLADLVGPSANAVCLDAEQLRWGCGRQGRAALYYIIRGATLTCRGSLAHTQPDAAAVLLARCNVAGQDLAIEVVRSGFARTTLLGSPALQAAITEARVARLGLWNGDWTILP